MTTNDKISIEELVRMAETRMPGISRSPLLAKVLKAHRQEITGLLNRLDPVRARSQARIKGFAKPLSDKEHIAILKAEAGVRTYHRKNTGARKAIAKHRRNYGPGDRAQVRALFQFFATVYKSNDRPAIALREMIQNSADAINDPKYGSKALGWIGKNDGRIDVTFDRIKATLTVEDNGCGMDERTICLFTTLSGSTKGKQVDDMTPEELAETYPPFGLTIKAFPRKSEDPVNPPNGGKYWVRINGIFQFTEDKSSWAYYLPADYLLDYTSAGSAGGFGAAKAVIFALSTDKPSNWTLHTRDNYYTGADADAETGSGICSSGGSARVKKVEYLRGTRMTIYGLDRSVFDGVVGSDYRPIETRLKEVMAANTLPGIKLYFNGELVPVLFPAGKGIPVGFGPNGTPWFDGIRQHPDPSPNFDPVILQGLTAGASNPQADDYIFSKGRDAFNRVVWRAFNQLRRSAEIDPESLKNKDQSKNVYFDPDSPSSADNPEIRRAMETAYTEQGLDEIIAQVQATIRDYTDVDVLGRKSEQARAAVKALQDEYADQDDESKVDEIGKEIAKADAQIKATVSQEVERNSVISEITQDLLSRQEVTDDLGIRIVNFIEALDDERIRQGKDSLLTITYRLNYSWAYPNLASKLRFGDWLTTEDLGDLLRLQRVLDTAAVDGGGGLAEIASYKGLFDALLSKYFSPREIKAAREAALLTNPFGAAIAGLVVRTEYTTVKDQPLLDWQGKKVKDDQGRVVIVAQPVFNQKRYNKFLRNYKKYLPLLMVWDQIVRLIVKTTNVKPANQYSNSYSLYTGYVLTDAAYAMYTRTSKGNPMVLLNVEAVAEYMPVFKSMPELAAYIHALAVHELAHMERGTDHGDGHDESFVIAREHLAFKTFGLLPVIGTILSQVSNLRNPYKKESAKDAKERYRKIAEDYNCPRCLKEVISSLESTGHLDTVRWVQARIGWDNLPETDGSELA